MEGYLLRLPLPECWVVSTLHMLIDAVTESYNKLFFGDVGREALPNRREALIISLVIFSALAKLHIVLG
ncbi:hypothetical protein ES288_D11G409700v1 [Gossypium darwinii]|uniref:Uncharacterized protein n=1 Tax=Gossypium darwinii TaxID=34276 RepID=A0A5D2AV12_GOSDA|nr:hypothetical protein ES288_D11G409700v1 [Gossypium darwinii]